MYKKIKLDREEENVFTTIIVLILIQALIIYGFLSLWEAAKPIDIKETRQIDITVDKIYIRRSVFSSRKYLVVVADSVRYEFHQSDIFSKEYSVRELKEKISVGDRLSLTYLKPESESTPWIVEAKGETETYRTLKETNRATKGTPIVVVILFFIFESIFLGVVVFYFWSWEYTFKSIKNKRRKNAERKKKYKEMKRQEKLKAKNV